MELFKKEAVDECQEHLQHILVLGESQVLLEEPEHDSPLGQMATRTVLFAYYMSGLLKKEQASPGTFDWEEAVGCLWWLRGVSEPEQTKVLAALVWEMEPGKVARLPMAARGLELEVGVTKACAVLDALPAHLEWPWDFREALTTLRKVLEQGASGAGICVRRVLRYSMKEIVNVFDLWHGQFQELAKWRKHLEELLALGKSLQPDDNELPSREAHVQELVTRVTLWAYYLLGLIQKIETSPSTFNWEKARQCLEWLQQRGELEQTNFLAALTWEMDLGKVATPFFAVPDACNVLLSLRLDPLRPFWDFSAALTVLRRVLELGAPGAAAEFEQLLRCSTEQLLRSVLLVLHSRFRSEGKEHLEELLAFGKSLLVDDKEPQSCEAPFQDVATRVVLFAYYLLGLIQKASCTSSVWPKARRCVEWLQQSGELEQTKILAALVWEMEPRKVAQLPIAAGVLKLDVDVTKTCTILKGLLANPKWPLWDIGVALPVLRRRLEHTAPRAEADFEDILRGSMQEMVHLFDSANWGFFGDLAKWWMHLEELLALGKSLLDDDPWPQSRFQDVVTRAILFAYYTLDIIRKAGASSKSIPLYIESNKLSRLLGLNKRPQLLVLAALVWKVQPDKAAELPVAHKALKLDQGPVYADRILKKFYSARLDLLWDSDSDSLAGDEDESESESQEGDKRASWETLFSYSPRDLELTQHNESHEAPQLATATEAPPLPQLPLEPEPEGPEAQHHLAATEQLPIILPTAQPPSHLVLPLDANDQGSLLQAAPAGCLQPPDSFDDQDLDLQLALEESVQEHLDPLQAVRRNHILMHRQAELLPDVEEHMVQHEELFLLEFQESSPESVERLRDGELLQPCRGALEEAGCQWLLEERDVKIFVDPCQYDHALRLLHQRHAPSGLSPRHVVVTESFRPLVLRALEGCPNGAAKLKSQETLGDVPLPEESEEPETETLQSNTQGGFGHEVPMAFPTQESRGVGPGSQSFAQGLPTPGENSQQPVLEDLYLLHFQRNSKDFQKRLHHDSRLQHCRQALEAAGCRWLLEDAELDKGYFGVKVFVHPTQYSPALQLLQRNMTVNELRLFPRHVVVTESFLQLVLDTLQGCTGGGGTLKPANGQVKIGEVPAVDPLTACLEMACMEIRGNGLNMKRSSRRQQVVMSTGTASNPRRRKPDFAAMSLSDSSQVGVHDLSSHGGRDDTMGNNSPTSRGQSSHDRDASSHDTQNQVGEVQGPSHPRKTDVHGAADTGLQAPPGLVLISEQLIQDQGLVVRGSFIDRSFRRPSKKPVAASTRTCQSNPRCRSVASEPGEV